MAWTVAIYLVERAYGGPEEGGWYYECGTPASEYANRTRGFAREGDARRYAEVINRSEYVQGLNQGRPDISSVLSKGRYEAVVCEGNPRPFPTEIPRYE